MFMDNTFRTARSKTRPRQHATQRTRRIDVKACSPDPFAGVEGANNPATRHADNDSKDADPNGISAISTSLYAAQSTGWKHR
eukprot:scaffold576_cov260-Pinguiococcus_pyrenoidosus.AAC.19